MTWIVRRVTTSAGIVLLMTLVLFVGLRFVGNPVDILVPPDADEAERARIIARFGLDRSLWEQYREFLVNALHGDLGRSFVYNRPALELIAERLPATLELALAAVVISTVVGVSLGLVTGLSPDKPVSRAIMLASVFGLSIPTFWFGLLIVMLFSVGLGWFPSSGRGETIAVSGVPLSFLTLDGLRHLALPAINLALFNICLILRLTRAGVREVMPLDYIRFAYARGLHPARIVGVHVLRNIAIPIVTVTGLEFCNMIAFSVVTETIFAWPGMGRLLIESIHVLDRPVIVAYLVMVVLIFVIVNLIADVAYWLLDPRISSERAI